MMKFRENEDAVSPVIGVILMVAITVILAAVIAAFVFGMASGVDTQPKIVAATAQVSGDYVVVTYQGGQDHGEVASVNCTVADADEPETNLPGGAQVPSPSVGHKWTVPTADLKGKTVVVTVSAEFKDGSEKIILDKNIRIPASSS